MIFVGTQKPGNPPEISGAIETLVQYGFDPRQTIDAVGILGKYWSEKLAFLNGSDPIRVMGLSIDFDAFCGPIIDALGRAGRTVATHCLWIADVPARDESQFHGLITSEHRFKPDLACRRLIVATAVMTEERHLELLVDRAAELYKPSEICILAAISSEKVMSRNNAEIKIQSLLRLPEHSPKFNPNTFGLYTQRLPSANVHPNFMPKKVLETAFPGMTRGMR
ncbi:hypothetical protein DFR48_10516 [Ciceribacter lividus]|uniref:Uncharacterized protein n=1 Tax=Ciceribacter lividus TaxID=1197950 RepID=A0A6I7HN01_9HYPH|nr:hypothetical protein [Ciceribacter lividus]RCW24679.1 hypothetical protein DFR48_10516 [Ciceribacter lividus]